MTFRKCSLINLAVEPRDLCMAPRWHDSPRNIEHENRGQILNIRTFELKKSYCAYSIMFFGVFRVSTTWISGTINFKRIFSIDIDTSGVIEIFKFSNVSISNLTIFQDTKTWHIDTKTWHTDTKTWYLLCIFHHRLFTLTSKIR